MVDAPDDSYQGLLAQVVAAGAGFAVDILAGLVVGAGGCCSFFVSKRGSVDTLRRLGWGNPEVRALVRIVVPVWCVAWLVSCPHHPAPAPRTPKRHPGLLVGLCIVVS